MSDQFLSAAIRTDNIINRVTQIEEVKNSIYFQEGPTCVLVLVRGRGGLGKTRLLEETLWRAGNPKSRQERPMPADAPPEVDWTKIRRVLITNLIDMRDTNLHSRTNFLSAIAEDLSAEVGEADFTRFRNERITLTRLQSQQSDFKLVEKALENVEEAFLTNYRAAASNRRIVLVVDTVEQFSYTHSNLLLKEGIITEKDLSLSTQQWLLDKAADGSLPNTAILLAGRGEEGSTFFQQVSEAQEKPGTSLQTNDISIEPFSEQDTAAYIKELERNWEKRAEQKPSDIEVGNIYETIRSIAEDEERVKVLHLYTGGQPVRLSLYTDLIINGQIIPKALNDTYEEAQARIAEKGIDPARFEIEDDFIRPLFMGQSLTSNILQVLVRAQRGVNTDQLVWTLDSRDDEDIASWQPPLKRVEVISETVELLRQLSIVKPALGGGISLQDEIYRIYSDHTSREEEDRRDECVARAVVFRKLKEWAGHAYSVLEKARREYQTADEQMIKVVDFTQALNVSFPTLAVDERDERVTIYQRMVALAVEEVYYALLLDPQRVMNEEYYELLMTFALASYEEGMVMAQAELWRIINDPFLLKFVDPQAFAFLERTERQEVIIERAAQQYDASMWARRFLLRGMYLRAIELLDKVEDYARSLTTERAYNSWNHTFARGERVLWRTYAMTRLAPSEAFLRDAVHIAEQMVDLAQHTHDQPVVTRPGLPGTGDYIEKGFIEHPAEKRLKNSIASIYNYIGFGYVNLGMYRTAIRMYGISMKYSRETRFEAQQATTLNNLARALSEIGRGRSRRVCLDGLKLRKKLAYEIPIAYSYNTLALIDNDQIRPDQAVIEASTALAYFRRNEDERGIALSLIQLGESLRRLVTRSQQGAGYIGTPDVIFGEAEKALSEAQRLVEDNPEKVRYIEALIELGCLYRDWLDVVQPEKSPKQWKQHYQNAQESLVKAAGLAHERMDLAREEIDAKVNLAWAYYRGGEHDKALDELDKVESDHRLVPAACLLSENSRRRPQPTHEKSYVYHQLSKMYTLRGIIAMDAFTKRTVKLASENKDLSREARLEVNSQDTEAREQLNRGAERFVLALAYAQLFSVRSVALVSIYDRLYEYVKGYNSREMADFLGFEAEAKKRYRTQSLQFEDLGDLEEFLVECFGIKMPGK